MRCVAADDAPERNDGVEAAGTRHTARDLRQLKRSGHSEQLMRRAGSLERLESAGEELVHHGGVPACRQDRDVRGGIRD